MGCSLAAERPPLLRVQPMDRLMPANAVVQHFARWLPHYLGNKAVLYRDSNGKGLEGIAWAGSAAPTDTQRFVCRAQAQGQSLQQWREHAAYPLLGVSSLVH